MATDDEQLLTTNGEITGQKLYQVRGDPQWHSTPEKARQVHRVLKKAEKEGYYKRKEEKRK